MRKSILSLVLVFGLLLAVVPAVANPFVSGGPSTVDGALFLPLPTTPFFQQIMGFQRQIHEAMTSQIEALKEGKSLAALWLLLLFSFGYGVFHVVAPGHGKVIVTSYFLGNHARWRDGIWAGLIMAIGHTVAAIVLVVVLNIILGLGQLTVLDKTRYVELIGYGMIAAIGLWLLVRSVRRQDGCMACGHDHAHDHHDHRHHDHSHMHKNHAHDTPKGLLKNKYALGLFGATSLVPCTGSMIILLFTLAHDVLWAGVLSVLAIALGMWVTVTAIGFASMALRRVIILKDNQDGVWRRRFLRGLSIAAALIIVLTGGLLFLGTLSGLVSPNS